MHTHDFFFSSIFLPACAPQPSAAPPPPSGNLAQLPPPLSSYALLSHPALVSRMQRALLLFALAALLLPAVAQTASPTTSPFTPCPSTLTPMTASCTLTNTIATTYYITSVTGGVISARIAGGSGGGLGALFTVKWYSAPGTIPFSVSAPGGIGYMDPRAFAPNGGGGATALITGSSLLAVAGGAGGTGSDGRGMFSDFSRGTPAASRYNYAFLDASRTFGGDGGIPDRSGGSAGPGQAAGTGVGGSQTSAGAGGTCSSEVNTGGNGALNPSGSGWGLGGTGEQHGACECQTGGGGGGFCGGGTGGQRSSGGGGSSFVNSSLASWSDWGLNEGAGYVIFVSFYVCPAGYYCLLTSPTAPLLCPSGASCPAGSTNYSLCPLGMYQSGWGSTSCQYCPAGYYSDAAGLTACKACPAGTYYSQLGGTSASACSSLTPTPQPASTTPSPSALSNGTSCLPSLFRTLPRMDLVGTLTGLATAPGQGFLAPSEDACRQACCVSIGCDAYAYVATSALFGVSEPCYLYANVTALIPSSTMVSSTLRSVYS